ncbi:unnamed protein product [Mytilus edulis]|uniref:Uncharacterized protein n=1 Tax=Mytilus edulis TaxID=6550 RepID=A0A8S3TEI5_MYTED|nr:unnamed protein product [Mytilus edulis]
MGALLGARLAKHLLENIGEMDVNFWCDSQIVISWIYSTKPLKNFIANRIKEIKGNVKKQQWKYCPTLDNPADQLTRGTSAEKFVQNKLWMHGPEWITNEHQWPSWHGNMTTTSLIVNEEDEEPVASLVLPAQTENTALLKEICRDECSENSQFHNYAETAIGIAEKIHDVDSAILKSMKADSMLENAAVNLWNFAVGLKTKGTLSGLSNAKLRYISLLLVDSYIGEDADETIVKKKIMMGIKTARGWLDAGNTKLAAITLQIADQV